MVSAAPSLDEADSVTGTIYSVSLVTAPNDTTVVEITLIDKETGEYRTVRVSADVANGLGLVEYDDDGNPVLVDSALWPESLVIPLSDILPAEEEVNHPVGN